jgi:hypothetical protein
MSVRKWVLLAAVVAGLIAAAAMSFAPPKPGLLLLAWASKAKEERPPAAVLIEMGLKDEAPTSWSSRAVVTGAKVVHREGYRFWEDDKLKEPDAWEASSHHAIRAPKGMPAVIRQEGIATVGVVLHLADVAADAVLTLDPPDQNKAKAEVPLKDVLAGKKVPVWDGAAIVRLVTTALPLTEDKTEDDFPAAAYGPDGTLWVAYIAYRDRDDNSRIERANLKEQPENFKAFYMPEFADRLFVKYYREGKWSEPIALTEANEDLAKCAVAVRQDGEVYVVYSAHRKGRFDIFARALTPNLAAAGKDAVKVEVEQQWTSGDKSAANLSPAACTDQTGNVWVSFQQWNADGVAAMALTGAGNGNPGEKDDVPHALSGPSAPSQGNHWRSSVAAGLGNDVTEAYDVYAGGDYDVALFTNSAGKADERTVAGSRRFEARPSACYDAKGRLWIAYEEGPEKWGKDYGYLAGDGNPLYSSRTVRVVCLEDGKLMEPVAELPFSIGKTPQEGRPAPNYHKHPRFSNPRLGLDGKGRLWLTYRQNYGTRYSSHPGSYWLTYARRLDGDHWTDPIEVAHSDGQLDETAVVLPHASGGVVIVHNTDGRFTTPNKIQNTIYVNYLDLPGDPVEPKLKARDPGKKNADEDKAEMAAVKRIRDYRIETGGKKYQLLRGDFHRHTEISFDGGADGSLDDFFRYAIDAAAFDWVANTDHDNGGGREYPWWLTQKFSDAYFTAEYFTPVFSYERSNAYPHGHRNVMFDHRGVRTLPRLAEKDAAKRVAGISPDDTKMLYRYLKEMGGICASHTSATSMGTDWRDNDPDLEPIVEIYQGDRNSYEYPGAPRAGYDPKGDKKPASVGGWEPKGFVNNALDEGYKLGFEASSDHLSTHISYSIALAEKHDRTGILDAFRKRHCYAATDNIILDVRSGEHLMGDSFQTAGAPKLDVHAIGTADIEEVAVLRDSKVVDVLKADGKECKAAWTDPKPAAGKHYYYIRITQKDKALAWGSPMWIDSGP